MYLTLVLGILPLAPCPSKAQADCDAPGSCSTAVAFQLFDLGCASRAFENYFRPEHWDALPPQTPAPGSFRVCSGGEAFITVLPQQSLEYQILIPAEGYLQIHWSIDREDLIVSSHTGQEMQDWNGTEGVFLGTVRTGQFFQLSLTNTGCQTCSLRISDFQFLTPARQVAVYPDKKGKPARTMILATAIDFSRILLPADREISSWKERSPSLTGWPVLDQDGHPASKHDQKTLKESTRDLQVTYEDLVHPEDGNPVILRKWTLIDLCNGNRMEHIQRIRIREDLETSTERLGNTRP